MSFVGIELDFFMSLSRITAAFSRSILAVGCNELVRQYPKNSAQAQLELDAVIQSGPAIADNARTSAGGFS